MIVVSDTTPLVYLILVECDGFLPVLYDRVVAPRAVISELSHRKAPELVRQWAMPPPDWLEVKSPHRPVRQSPPFGPGELEAMALAEELHADALLIDDSDGRQEAVRRQLPVLGTLRVLADAAAEKLIDLPDVVHRLRQTSFRATEDFFEWLLSHEGRDQSTP